MEKNKLTTQNVKDFLQSGVKKVGSKLVKAIPAGIITATLLNCASMHAAQPTKTNQSVKMPTAIVQQNESNKAFEKYKPNYKVLEKVYYSKLNNVAANNMSDEEINVEYANLMAEISAELMRYAAASESFEKNAIAKSGLSIEEINHISKTRGMDNSTDAKNMYVAQAHNGHFNHLSQASLATYNLRADYAEIEMLDENDGHNEMIEFVSKNKRNFEKDSNAILEANRVRTANYILYIYNVYNKSEQGKKVVDTYNHNLDSLGIMIVNSRQTSENLNAIKNITKDTSKLMTSLSGTAAMNEGNVYCIALQKGAVNIHTKLKEQGHDMDKVDIAEYVSNNVKNGRTTFDGIRTEVAVYNTNTEITTGANARSQINDQSAILWGGEVSGKIGYNDNSSVQLKGTVGYEHNFGNGNTLTVTEKMGVDIGNKNAGIALGTEIMGKTQINDIFSIRYGGGYNYASNRGSEFYLKFGPRWSMKYFNLDLSLALGLAIEKNYGFVPTIPGGGNGGTTIDGGDGTLTPTDDPITTEPGGTTDTDPTTVDPEKLY